VCGYVLNHSLTIDCEKNTKRLDEATVEIIRGINHLLLKAESNHLITVLKILKDARESIALWAAHDDYNESDMDRIVHALTMDMGLHLASIVESSADATISKSTDGTILSWNAAAERMFGYSSCEMLGRNIRTLIPDALQKEEDSIISRLVQGKSIDHLETIRLHKSGKIVKLSLNISPIHNQSGKVVGASNTARMLPSATLE